MKIRHLTAMLALVLAAALAMPAAAQGVRASDSNERQAPQAGRYVDPELASNLKSGGSATASAQNEERSPIAGMIGANPQLQIQHGLRQRFDDGERIDLVVGFEMPDLSPAYGMTWEQRGEWVFATMRRYLLEHQKPLQAYFDQQGVSYESLEVGNLMLVEQADSTVFQTLANYRSAIRIYEQSDFRLIEPEQVGGMQTQGGSVPEPNLDQIRATDVWSQLGVRGENIVIGLNDSSPRYTHEVLVNQYRGNNGDGTFTHDYNWFDPSGSASEPVPDFHGSHVLGIMVGDDGVANATGVAPGAEWMACRGCQGTGCPDVVQCLNYFVAPTDRNGDNPDPGLRPHVVNNSWGDCSQSYNAAYDPVWDTMYAAGVIPFFSNGNASNCGYSSPPGPNTVGNPARSGRVMGIGSSTQTGGNYAPHSNWGPTDNPNPGLPDSFDDFGFPDVKPNVIAPGQGIRSVDSTADNTYTFATGTSMASPHATGVAALMISAAPCLAGNHQAIGTILMDTAVGIDYDSGVGTEGPGNVPNYATGWGEIDALAAVQSAVASCGPTGEVSGVVTDADTGQALTGVDVSIPNPAPTGPADFNTTTDTAGEYGRTLPVGTYDISFSRFGYVPQSFTQPITEDDQITLDVAMQPADVVSISGAVSDAETGWGLHARLEIDGAPDSPYFTDPVSGTFSINLPEEFSSEITVIPLVPGYTGTQQPITVQDGLVLDIGLNAEVSACAAPGYEPIGVLYAENFNSGDGGFTVSAAGGALPWEFGAPEAWPGRCNSGNECWGTNLDGNYANDADETLMSPEIDLTGVTGDVELRWAQATDIESATFDSARAEVSVNGGPWELMWEHSGDTAQVDWQSLSHTISGASGGTVQFRFSMQTDGSVAYDGYFVDDLRLVDVDAFDCVAPDDGSLLFGQVTDANTGNGVPDALVDIVGRPSPSIVSTSDPTYDEGVFHAYLPGGIDTYDLLFADRFEQSPAITGGATFDVPVTASRPPYTAQSAQVSPVNGQTVGAFLELTAGRLEIQPEAPEVGVTFNEQLTSQMALINTGTQPLTFQIDGVVTDVITPVYEEDFEAAFPPAGWSIESQDSDCDWQRNDAWPRPNYAGGDGFAAAADSDICGAGTFSADMDTSLVTPSFDLTTMTQPGYSFVLSFRDFSTSQLDLDISTDGGASWTTLESWSENTSAQGPGTQVSGNLIAYADEPDVRLRFRYVSGWDYWAQIDQFRITDASPWLSVTPENGTFFDGNQISAATAQNLDLNFDASLVPEPGTYQAEILITHDTPYDGGFTSVPVVMNVGLSPGLARLEGLVEGLGYCDDDPSPASSASIEVVGQSTTYNATVDGNGEYGLFIPVDESPVTINASAPGHVASTHSDILLASQQVSVEDIDLRLDAPCASISPQSSAQSLDSGEQLTFQAVLRNDGAGEWNWSESLPGIVDTGSIYLAEDNAANGFSANYFPNQGDTYVVPSDDFTVEGQSLYRLAIDGFALPSSETLETVADAFTFAIYADNNGQPAGDPETPGSALFQYTGNLSDPAFTVDAPGQIGRIEIDLVEATGGVLNLPDGQYWIAGWATSPSSQPTGPRWIHFNTDAEVRGDIAQIWVTEDGAWAPVDSDLAFEVSGGAVCGQFISIPAGSGTLAADSVEIVNMQLDANGVLPGSYTDSACFDGDDSVTPVVTHDVEVEVTAPATFGTVSGQIEGAGYCDAEPGFLEGAEVTIDGASGPFTVTTDATGSYSAQVEAGSYTVSASAPDHVADSAPASVSAQATTTQDLTLRLDAPCFDASPQSFTLSVLTNEQVDETIALDNNGAASVDWFFEGSVPAPLTGYIRLDGPATSVAVGHPGVGSPSSSGEFIRSDRSVGSASFDVNDLEVHAPVTLSHSSSLSITEFNTVACGNSGEGTTTANAFYRTFTLTDFGIIGDLDVEEVQFGIEALDTTIDLDVTVYQLDGALSTANLIELGTTTQSFSAQDLQLVTVPVTGTVPAGETLVVEIAAPDLSGTGFSFYPGSNAAGETAPSYINSFGSCGISDITSFSSIGFPDVHLVMTVSGEEVLNCDAVEDLAWLSADQLSGTIASDSNQSVTLTFDGSSAPLGETQAEICALSDDERNPLVRIPITLTAEEPDALTVNLENFASSYDQGETSSGAENVAFTYTQNAGNVSQIFNVFTIEQGGAEVDPSVYDALFDIPNTSWDDYIRGIQGTTVDNVVAPTTRDVSISFSLESDAPTGNYDLRITSYDVTGIAPSSVSVDDAKNGLYPILAEDSAAIEVVTFVP